ncbi:MAG: hypothetical protein PWQ96_1928 [Clostridia bacterium]|nr:cation efflux family protein [Clostridiales bacterium]MDK2986284.1 hypothetical protein [Clostridia bacterium]
MDIKSKTAALSVISNVTLVIIKLAVGLYINSVSVISEAVHSASDLIAAMIAFFSVKAASKPADEEHKYGHGKFENIAATIEAILIFAAAAWIIYEAYNKFTEDLEVEFLLPGIIVMLISAAVNMLVSNRLYSVAKKTDSVALEADALHLRTDVYTSGGIVLGLVAIQITGYHWLDPVFAIFVALLIIKASIKLFKEAFLPLLDVKLPESEETAIKEIIERHSAWFVDFHELRTRKSGSERHIDLHLVVPKYHHVQDAYEMCNHIKTDILKIFPKAHVLIHLEPCECDETCEKGNECKKIQNYELDNKDKKEF